MKHISPIPRRRLAVSLVALGLAAGVITALAMRQAGQSNLERAAEMISRNLLLARQKAIASRTRYRIVYDSEHKEFRVYRRESASEWVLDPPSNRYPVPDGITVRYEASPSPGSILIDTDGNIAGATAPILVSLSDGKQNHRSIHIAPNGAVQEIHRDESKRSWK